MRLPYARQDVREEDIEAVLEVLRSPFLTQGPVVPLFERALADRVGAKFAVAVNSATSALHLACLALGVAPGDLVWTSAISFVASANCARYCGADVDFIDVDPITGNLSLVHLRERLEEGAKVGILPKVVIAVHLAGRPIDMASLAQLAQEFDFRIIEDASHALGARLGGESIGSCKHSDVCVFSFHPVKLITTGEGGVAVTNSERLSGTMRLLRSHGITRDENLFEEQSHGPWYYEQLVLGYNYRMTDFQAALGLSQLNRLEWYIRRRNELARLYDALLMGSSLRLLPPVPASDTSAFHLYIVHVENRLDIVRRFAQQGIEVNVHYRPIYRQPYYRHLLGQRYLEGAERFYHSALTLPLFPAMSEDDVRRVATILCSAREG